MMYVPMITVSHSITALKTVTMAKAREPVSLPVGSGTGRAA
jgi:hypothetical protein